MKREYDITDRLFIAYAVAKDKHPVFARGKKNALDVITDEVEEFKQAINKESRERQREEAWDIIVCCLRFILGEQHPRTQHHIEQWVADEDDPAVKYYEERLRK